MGSGLPSRAARMVAISSRVMCVQHHTDPASSSSLRSKGSRNNRLAQLDVRLTRCRTMAHLDAVYFHGIPSCVAVFRPPHNLHRAKHAQVATRQTKTVQVLLAHDLAAVV